MNFTKGKCIVWCPKSQEDQIYMGGHKRGETGVVLDSGWQGTICGGAFYINIKWKDQHEERTIMFSNPTEAKKYFRPLSICQQCPHRLLPVIGVECPHEI